VQFPGALSHVKAPGNERKPIFRDKRGHQRSQQAIEHGGDRRRVAQ
jgi:hypothetical protein